MSASLRGTTRSRHGPLPSWVLLLLGPFLAGCLQGSPPSNDVVDPSESVGIIGVPGMALTEPTTLVFRGPGDFHVRAELAQTVYYKPPQVRPAPTNEGNNYTATHWAIAAPESFVTEMLARPTCLLQADNSQAPVSFTIFTLQEGGGAWQVPMAAGVWHVFVHVSTDTEVFMQRYESEGGETDQQLTWLFAPG